MVEAVVRWVAQPEGSDLCGQIAVAVITGLELEEVVERGFEGREGETKTKHLVRALRRLGFECGDRLRRGARPELAIAKLSWGIPNFWDWHWVVVDGDRIWDGAYGSPDGTVRWPAKAKLTSFLSVSSRDSATSHSLLP